MKLFWLNVTRKRNITPFKYICLVIFLQSCATNHSQFGSKEPVTIKDNFDKVDGGISYGFGGKFPVSNKFKFFVEYDVQLGLTGMFRNENRYISVRHAVNAGINFLLY
jgi:hypothetical protein